MSEPKNETGDRRSMPLWGMVLLTLAAVVLLALAGPYVLFLPLVLFVLLPVNMAPGALGLLVALLLLAVTALPFRGKWRYTLRRFAGAGALVALLALGGTAGWNAYQASITIVDNTNIDTSRYLPFTEDSQIARLEGEVSLRFSTEDDLPLLDGKNSLFPLCAAMVNAAYPSDAFLNQVSSTTTYLGAMGYYKYLGSEDVDIHFVTAPAQGREWYWEDVPAAPQPILLSGEGLVFFTHADNPVESLTREQLRDIYAGKITNWAEVGGTDTPILPYQHDCYSDGQAALQRFMGEVPLAEPITEERRYLSGDGGEYLADYRNSPGAIGFTFSAYADQLQEKYHIKLLAVDGVYPDEETISRGDYPVTDGIYMVVRPGEQSQEVDRFIAWALSEEGQELVARAGYAPAAKMGSKDRGSP